MKKPRLVVIGNGLAGMRTLEELLRIAPDLYDISVFGAEPHASYNRRLLSPVLAGEQRIDQTALQPRAWYAEHGIKLHLGKEVVSVNRIRREVMADDCSVAEYDRLVIATGSQPGALQVPGKDLEGVHAWRDIDDTQALIDATRHYRHAVVIGGGVLGLEAAYGLVLRGMQTTVVQLAPWLMERQLDEAAAALLQRVLQAKGLKFALGAVTQGLIGDRYHGRGGRVMAVQLQDGREIPADLVVMAIGICPNTELARCMGLHCTPDGRGGRGDISVNDTLQSTTDARIYAVGECAAHRGITHGLVAPLNEQAKVCATHLAQRGIGLFTGGPVGTQLNISGIDVFSAGDFMGGAGTEQLVRSDAQAGIYNKLVIKDDQLVGACLVGDAVHASACFKLLREGRKLGKLRDQLMSGEHTCAAPAGGTTPLAATSGI